MVVVTALCQQEKILLVIFLTLQHHTVGFSFFLDKKRNKKIKDEGCTFPSSGSYDGHWCYCASAFMDCYCYLFLSTLLLNNRITNVEITVVQKPHQGTIPKWGCNPFRGSFFGSFLEKQKRTQPLERSIKKYCL